MKCNKIIIDKVDKQFTFIFQFDFNLINLKQGTELETAKSNKLREFHSKEC